MGEQKEMRLRLKVKISVVFYARKSLNPLTIDNVIEKEYNEESEEFKQLSIEFEKKSGLKRNGNEDEFDKKFLGHLVDETKKSQINTINRIAKVIKECYYEDKYAYIELCGYIINPKDFCAVKISGFEFEVSKQ